MSLLVCFVSGRSVRRSRRLRSALAVLSAPFVLVRPAQHAFFPIPRTRPSDWPRLRNLGRYECLQAAHGTCGQSGRPGVQHWSTVWTRESNSASYRPEPTVSRRPEAKETNPAAPTDGPGDGHHFASIALICQWLLLPCSCLLLLARACSCLAPASLVPSLLPSPTSSLCAE